MPVGAINSAGNVGWRMHTSTAVEERGHSCAGTAVSAARKKQHPVRERNTGEEKDGKYGERDKCVLRAKIVPGRA